MRRNEVARRLRGLTHPSPAMLGVKKGRVRGVIPVLGIFLLLLSPAMSAAAAAPDVFPEVIPLPDNFQPEGITVGRGTSFFVGSLANGAIYRGDLRTGQGDVLVAGDPGRTPAVGLAYDSRTDYLYVAGGPTGAAHVYDATSGQLVTDFQLTQAQLTFVNDVVVTRTGAYFTDSFRPYMYYLPLTPNGALPDPGQVEEIELVGDFRFDPGQPNSPAFNANGIDATPNGKWLIVVNSTFGTLYRVDPGTEYASQIDLGGDDVTAGDGLLLDDKTLFVVQNVFNQIAVVELDPQLTSGSVTRHITDSDFDVPTTVAGFGSALYAVNARFRTEPPFPTEFQVVRVPKH